MKFRFCGDLDCPDWVLAEVATLSQLTSVRIRILVVQILKYCVQGSFDYAKVLKLASENSDGVSDIKGSVAAVHFMVTSAAKHDVDESSFVQEIQQLGLPKENAEAIARQYREHKDTLRDKFSEDSYRVSKLVSADWRVDRIIALSGEDPAVTTVQFMLKVDALPHAGAAASTETSSRIKDIVCEMPAEKLDVLIHELSFAQSMMESLHS